jgi:TonB family protein
VFLRVSVRRREKKAALLTILAALVSLSAVGQPETAITSNDPSAQAVPLELFKAPRPKHIALLCDSVLERQRTPNVCEDVHEGVGGWAELGFMVDQRGKPFEVTVIRSTGNTAFDEFAMKSIELSTFEPGTTNGQAIESGYEMKFLFIDGGAGAKKEFFSAYKALLQAVKAADRGAADLALQKLRVTNLYEDALFGLARYDYATHWGDEREQLEALRRATAEGAGARYLSTDMLRTALLSCMQLELKANEYAEAMTTWKRLQKAGIDKSTAARFQPVMDHLQSSRTDDSTYEVDGFLSERGWYLHLFKRHFRADVTEGYISQVKLRCDKRYVYFAFDPALQYEISSKYGNCSIELVGGPGTRFKLVQF